MTTPAHRRLLRDFKKVTMDTPEGISAAPDGDDLFKWTAIMFGPAGTPWEGGVWKLAMKFPAEYPELPPSVRFVSEIFHPNVYKDGRICLDLLANSWSPAYDVCSVLLGIQSLVASPDPHATPEGGANPDAEFLFMRDRTRYNAKIEAIVAAQLNADDLDMESLSAVP
mmetsp:Transcript_5279/g.12720  ORF Transcript_5279/g.12720 Transcript_5279/m.12720 type:complete len:168 (-) Transcript_5279:96-599(-)